MVGEDEEARTRRGGGRDGGAKRQGLGRVDVKGEALEELTDGDRDGEPAPGLRRRGDGGGGGGHGFGGCSGGKEPMGWSEGGKKRPRTPRRGSK